LTLAALWQGAVQAQQQNSAQASITLRASVPATCAVTLSAESATLNLTAGVTNQPVATVAERCNAANGYTVNLASGNGGALSSGSASIAYTLHYGDSSSGNGSLVADRAASGAPRQTVLSITVPPGPARQAGDYQDTVTISIAAK
jgi:spore coat protein U-like protein